MYSWASRKAKSPHSAIWLGAIFLLELMFFLPMDAILLLFCVENPKQRYYYALAAIVASLISGIIGYSLGYAAWEMVGSYLLTHLISNNLFQQIVNHYQYHQHLALFVGAFFPIPFKIVALSAGICELLLSSFLSIILLARSLRFLLIAAASYKWGLPIKSFIEKHFHRFLIIISGKIVLTLLFFWIFT